MEVKEMKTKFLEQIQEENVKNNAKSLSDSKYYQIIDRLEELVSVTG